MRNDILQKRIPTLLGILLITIGVGLTSYLTKSGIIFVGKAAPIETPENVRITNVSDSSFTVSYTTVANIPGSLSFGRDKKLGKTYLDDRDQQTGKINNYKIHHLTVRDLEPNTKYYFVVISGQITFFNQNDQESPFEVVTGPTIIDQPKAQQPMVGKIILPDSNKPNEAIIYVTAKNAQTISTLVKLDGSYILPLNSIRSSDLKNYYNFLDNNILQLLVLGESLESQVLLFINQINPVPAITLSKDYDFTINSSALATPSAKTASLSADMGFPSFSASPAKNKSSTIVIPEENQKFSDSQPLFKGTASPGATVKIIVHSPEEIKTEIKADKNGNWNYRPAQKLSPGEHTISVLATDQFGISKTLTQAFTVYASGTQVSESATPSATPTIAVTPTIIISPNLPSPTSFPTIVPTIILTPEPTKSPIQSPGSSSLNTLTAAAVVSGVIALFIFLLSRGSMSL